MTLTIQKRLVEVLEVQAEGSVVSDVRIGLGYTAVRLQSGHAGVAWTAKSDAACCTHFKEAGTLAGRPADELLRMLANDTSALARTVGLATANALLAAQPAAPTVQDEVISSLSLTLQDRVVMIGYFSPIIAQIRKIGCRLDVVELNSHHGETLTPEQGREPMAQCSVAIVTGTSLVNGTCDEVLAGLGQPRAAVLLGPSSPLCPDAFTGTPITHVAGSRVHDAEALLRVVSEGGGTMLMKPHLVFETVLVGSAA
ncbi:MAG: DUF364 domain-containing protein [Geobacteraceae bacterium]|nr:DUF364 domain-containing protein [Geobacteraceae bacterium]